MGAFSILGLSFRSVWAVDRQPLFRRDALPGDLAVFLTLAGPARRRNENHTLALKAHTALRALATRRGVRGRTARPTPFPRHPTPARLVFSRFGRAARS